MSPESFRVFIAQLEGRKKKRTSPKMQSQTSVITTDLLTHMFQFPLISLYTSLQAIVMANIIQWNGVSYNKQPYPGWAELLGWMMALASILLIPGFAIHQMWKTPGTLSKVSASVSDFYFILYRLRLIYIFVCNLFS